MFVFFTFFFCCYFKYSKKNDNKKYFHSHKIKISGHEKHLNDRVQAHCEA